MDTLLQDLRFALRSLGRSPAFLLTAVITLALGIGANTAVFSVVRAVMLKPLPYPSGDRLVSLWGTRGAEQRLLVSILDMDDWKARNHTLEDIGIIRSQSVNITGGETPDRLTGSFVTASTLRITGAKMEKGRVFTDEETTLGTGQQVAVISFATWSTRFGGDQNILGRAITLNGLPHVVIGVTAASYSDPYGPIDIWLPITSAPNRAWFTRPVQNVWAIARRKPNASVADVQKDLSTIAAGLAKDFPASNAGFDAKVQDLRESLVGSLSSTLTMVQLFVAAVLLIACANVANLQLARATARRREMSVRAALGAGRGRLLRQLLTESLVLALVGGVAGLVVAVWATNALVTQLPGGLPSWGVVGMDLEVLGFSAAITLGAGLLFGAMPAIHAARTNLASSLTQRGGSGGAMGRRLDPRNVFVAVQLALCVVLLVGAGLLTRSLVALQAVKPGFDATHLLTAEFRLPAAKYKTPEQILLFAENALAELRAVPAFKSAALLQSTPLTGNYGRVPYQLEGASASSRDVAPVAVQNAISDGFFETMKIPMLQGRDFNATDAAHSPLVVIVSTEFARRSWPNEAALGKRVTLLGTPDVVATVVGVVGDIKQRTINEPPNAQLYQPRSQAGGIFISVAARTVGDPSVLANQLRGAIWKVDRDQPVWRVQPMERLMEGQMATPKFTLVLTGAFAGLACLLAVVGVYGVMSYVLTQRTREVGIRMALGAARGQVVRMVLVSGAKVIAAATVLGLIGAFAATRFMRSQLYNVAPTDVPTFVVVPALLAAVALLACYIPARRAARVDPLVALRAE